MPCTFTHHMITHVHKFAISYGSCHRGIQGEVRARGCDRFLPMRDAVFLDWQQLGCRGDARVRLHQHDRAAVVHTRWHWGHAAVATMYRLQACDHACTVKARARDEIARMKCQGYPRGKHALLGQTPHRRGERRGKPLRRDLTPIARQRVHAYGSARRCHRSPSLPPAPADALCNLTCTEAHHPHRCFIGQ